jgi:aconitate hydratase 2/2-methylisocitrate dehydratase
LTADQAFTFTDWSAEMKAKASICISEDATLIESLEIAKSRIQIMIDKGMDNKNQVLQGLIDKANKRIAEIQSGEKPALRPDANAKYYAEVVVDLDQIAEPMIADPDVNNADVSKDIHTIPSDHYLITVATRKLTLASSVLVWFTKAI